MAASTRLSTVPSATVEPMSLRMGTEEKESSPNPNTVDRLAKRSETRVRSRSSRTAVCAIEEQRIVRAHRHHEQQADQVKDRKLRPAENDARRNDDDRGGERKDDSEHAPPGAQCEGEQHDDGRNAEERMPQRFASIRDIKRVGFMFEIDDERVTGRLRMRPRVRPRLHRAPRAAAASRPCSPAFARAAIAPSAMPPSLPGPPS